MTDKLQSFTWSDERELNSSWDIINLFQAAYNGHYYELPYSINAHSKYFYSLLHIRSALQVKANILGSTLKTNAFVNQRQMAHIAMDYLWFGNAYVEKVLSRTGKLLTINHSPAKHTRRDKECYKFINHNSDIISGKHIHSFAKDSVYHLLQYDVNQEIYGVPEWLPAIQSAQLNEEATKFRLRYYRNGSHAGYIIYLNDANFTKTDIDNLKEQMKLSKGPGNFRNLLLYAPNGKADGIKLLPISEVTAKDEFFNIKAVSRDDQLAAARIPPNLMGIVPTNTSGFGSVKDAATVFARHEIEPLQGIFTEFNEWLGVKVFEFKPYTINDETASI